MRRVLPALLLGFGLCAAPWVADAQSSPVAGQSPEPILVELFTSEGCSSCPPADALLQRITGKVMPSGRPIITISEHVTYWNHTGWVDPFSTDAATQRQEDYVERMRLESGAYTPQMVVNGVTQLVGSDEHALDNALLRADQLATGVALRIDSATANKSSVDIQFEITGDVQRAKHIEVYAFVTDDEDQVHVRGGENADRVLTHVSVARSVAHAGVRSGISTGTIRVRLPSGMPVGGNSGRHLLLVAQQDGDGQVLAVATRPL